MENKETIEEYVAQAKEVLAKTPSVESIKKTKEITEKLAKSDKVWEEQYGEFEQKKSSMSIQGTQVTKEFMTEQSLQTALNTLIDDMTSALARFKDAINNKTESRLSVGTDHISMRVRKTRKKKSASLSDSVVDDSDKVVSLSKVDEQIIRDYTLGVPIKLIMEKHNVGTQRIYRTLSRAGIPRRYSNTEVVKNIDLEDNVKVRELIRAYSDKRNLLDQICSKFDVSVGQLYYILDRYNIPRREGRLK